MTSSSLRQFGLLFTIIYGLFMSSCGDQSGVSTVVTPISKGLKDYTDIPIGGGVNIRKVLKDSTLQDIVIRDFSSLTATNDMKMYSIARSEGIDQWAPIDTLVAFCERHDKRLFGHTLVWHYGLPNWIEENTAKNGDAWAQNFLKGYIQKVVGRYKGKVAAWDVVNEAFESSGATYRETFWYKSFGGSDYIAKAFEWAHEADPDAELFYNDFNIERDTVKLNAVLKMIEELRQNNVPITGIGFQMHLRMDIPDEIIAYTLQKAADTGLKVHISELDIIFNNHDDTAGGGDQKITVLTDELRQAQAEKYKNLVIMYRRIVPPAQQYGITFWDFTDRDTWIKPFFKIEDWPTVYDENLKPKPAYQGFIQGLTESQ
jgi:endo-1,4-beta-xylanase